MKNTNVDLIVHIVSAKKNTEKDNQSCVNSSVKY